MSFLEKILVSAIRWQLPTNPSNCQETEFRKALHNTLKRVYLEIGKKGFWQIIQEEVYTACQESCIHGYLFLFFPHNKKRKGWYKTWQRMLRKGVEGALNFDPYWIGEIISAYQIDLSEDNFWDSFFHGTICFDQSPWYEWLEKVKKMEKEMDLVDDDS